MLSGNFGSQSAFATRRHSWSGFALVQTQFRKYTISHWILFHTVCVPFFLGQLCIQFKWTESNNSGNGCGILLCMHPEATEENNNVKHFSQAFALLSTGGAVFENVSILTVAFFGQFCPACCTSWLFFIVVCFVLAVIWLFFVFLPLLVLSWLLIFFIWLCFWSALSWLLFFLFCQFCSGFFISCCFLVSFVLAVVPHDCSSVFEQMFMVHCN